MSSLQNNVPSTPRVTSPTPPPSEPSESRDEYSGPVTRAAARRQRLSATPEVPEEDARERRVRTDSKSTKRSRPRTSSSGSQAAATPSSPQRRHKSNVVAKSEPLTNGSLPANGHLSPPSNGAHSNWRNFSRSPSPLGLIPLHARYRYFIHRHEIPRKALHVSIGFITLYLYRRGIQPLQITPWLFSALVPIAAVDVIRHRSQKVNNLYIRCVGALMRETEVKGYNGVIWYLLGAYFVLRVFPKDIGVMGVLLLSWCDTAASTFGRLWGRHTIRLRHGKSLAGTLAAWFVGVFTAAAFWGWFVPYVGTFPNDPEDCIMFKGSLNLLPDVVKGLLGWTADTTSAVVMGPVALGVMSFVSGLVAAGSEFIDLFGWDDNLTIPVLSGIGLWGFLKVFG
ncbi:hypothetical protein MPDQ_005383 [Monascus purpureus]|uniref:Phosphatidate cytidylyltransferase n=1 Tax=Monascus purpureus TaxID=5098 RepID=A0A507R010_MONPU|nr:hypothetical protein MPDQ_005383 [Monascus purpureus]BDD60071.1 hypothetical protein MAP00_005235 [Monascus purpureus]